MSDDQHADSMAKVEQYLRMTCGGVFSEDAIAAHLDEHVGMATQRLLADDIRQRVPTAKKILDVGCGFGSFVLALREAGVDAVGVDLAEFEIDFARARLGRERPADNPHEVYHRSDGLDLSFDDEEFDAVTLWNVLEHVPDAGAALREAIRVVRPGGSVFVFAPNYAAFRREAHYHVPWLPLLPRPLASRYLRKLGKDPAFFEQDIYYVTVAGVYRILSTLPVEIMPPFVDRLQDPSRVNRRHVRLGVQLLARIGLIRLLERALLLTARNPLRSAIEFHVRRAQTA